MNSEATIKNFKDILIPFLRETGMENNIVIMDGARCHFSKKTCDWLKNNRINVMNFGGNPIRALNGYPPNSPDLNPIEIIFSYWNSQVLKHNSKTVRELIDTVKNEWTKIQLSFIRKCINRLRKVMEWVDIHNGDFYNE